MLCIIYNTFGLRSHRYINRDNSDYYIDSINSLLAQDFNDFRVVLSDCLSPEHIRTKIRERFGSRISYCFTNTLLPIFVTFNLACKKAFEHFANVEGYLYVESGMNFSPHTGVVSRLYDEFVKDKENIGMIAAPVDNDNNYHWFMHEPDPYQNGLCAIGQHVNLHTLFIAEKMCKFYGKCLPDVFQGCGSEGTYPYLCSALRLKMLTGNFLPVLRHQHTLDEHHIGFPGGDQLWFYLRHDSIRAVAQRCGIGFEEWRDVGSPRNHALFDEQGMAKSEDLAHALRDNLYLRIDEIDYDKIDVEFIE